MGRILHGVGWWKTQSIKASTSDVCYFNGSGFVTGAALINQVFHQPTPCKNRPTFFSLTRFLFTNCGKKAENLHNQSSTVI
jgi:hypothetical protein